MQNKTIAVIRNSLAAANAALDLLDAAPAEKLCSVTSTVVEVTPLVVEAVEKSPSLGARIAEELKDSVYDLRTTSELGEKFNVSSNTIREALLEEGILFVIKHRRSDSAELIGLSSRN